MDVPSLYIRKNSDTFLSDIIHEGTHVMDGGLNIIQVPYSVNPYIWEKRAYFYERQFQKSLGVDPEFKFVQEMLDFVYKKY